MVIVKESPYLAPYLIHDAPVNEKTKQVRERFKVDEATGYPEFYSWRALARLGPDYKPEDPFLKFDPYNPDEYISTKLTYVTICFVSGVGGMMYINRFIGRPLFFRFGRALVLSTLGSGMLLWGLQKSMEQQAVKNRIIVDYLRQHPERFGTIHRPKFRELLHIYRPVR